MARLDESRFRNQPVSVTYPHIKLLKVSDVTPLVIGLLDTGDTSVVAVKDNVEHVVASISLTVKNINSILRTHKDVVLVGEEKQHYLANCKKFMEVMIDNGYDSVFDN